LLGEIKITQEDLEMLKGIATTHKHLTYTEYRPTRDDSNEIIGVLADAIEDYFKGGEE